MVGCYENIKERDLWVSYGDQYEDDFQNAAPCGLVDIGDVSEHPVRRHPCIGPRLQKTPAPFTKVASQIVSDAPELLRHVYIS